jgi:integrase
LRPEKVRFEELAEDFLNDYRINGKRSLDKAQRSVKHLQGFFGGMRAIDITTDKVRAYIKVRQEEGYANAEINRELAALKRMFNLSLQQSPPKVSHKPYIPMLQERNVRTGFFEHDEFTALRAALPPVLRPVVTFAYYTGWRKQEILGLTWDRVDLHASTVRLDPGTTKNQEGRTVYLDGELRETMMALRTERDTHLPLCPWVFYRSERRIKDFRYAWHAACQTVGLQGKLFHDFRRTAVRNMIRAGIPERVAQQIAGHKTRSVFDRYHIVSYSDLREAARRHTRYVSGVTVTKTVTASDVDEFLEEVQKRELLDSQGAGGRNRTDTRLPSRDFESRASTSSTTPAFGKSSTYSLPVLTHRARFLHQLHQKCTTKLGLSRTRLHHVAGSG